MSDARRRAALIVLGSLTRSQFQGVYETAESILEDLVEEGLIEFANCKCGTFAFHTTHHPSGCVHDEVIA